MANKKMDLAFLKACRDKWFDLPEEAIPEEKREQYKARRKAVDMYIDGMKGEDIARETGVDRRHIARYVNNCLKVSEDGQPLGYYGLIPHLKKVDASDKGRNFFKLLEQNPGLIEFIVGNYFGDSKYTLEKNMNYKTLHENFIKECKRRGIQDYEYPLNTENKGYVSLIKFVKDFVGKNIDDASKRENKDAAQKLMSTGKGVRYSQNSMIPYNVVQFDGHKLDIGYVVEIDNNDGTFSKTMALRPWFLAVIDVSTRVILGYAVTQSENYNQFETISAIRNAILPHEPVNLTIPGLKYPDNGGFPSTAFSDHRNALFNVIMLDNAKAHLAANTRDSLVEKLQCTLAFGSVATPETRGIIERFFRTLETMGFHRLPGTTGSNTKDPKRKNPEKEVVKYDITYDQICEILDVLVAEYNNTPHKALNNETPLEAMERKHRNPFLRPTIADDRMLKMVNTLTHFTHTATVRGSIKNGKRPYIQYMNAIYRNDILASDSSWIGKKITIEVDPDDLTYVVAYSDTGKCLGYLHAAGGYGRTKHTLKSRKAAAKLARENGRDKNIFVDPIHDYQQHLQKTSKGNRRAATKADQVRREACMPELSEKDDNENRKSSNVVPLHREEAHPKDAPVISTKVTEIIDGKTVTRPMTMDEYFKAKNLI